MKTYHVHFSSRLDPGDGDLLADFQFPWLERECPRTHFRAVHDRETLAFRFDVDDEDLVLGEGADPGEGALGSDRVELFFASEADLKQPYYGAEMDPTGRVYDYRATLYRNIDPKWGFSNLRVKGTIREGGYSVAGTFSLVELRELGCLKGEGGGGVVEIVAGAYRAEFSHGESAVVEDWISWIDPGTETADFHVPTSFGRFLLLEE